MVIAWQEFQPIGAIATTPSAVRHLQPLCQAVGVHLWIPEALQADFPDLPVYSGSLKDHLAQIWPQYRSLLFGLATGAVVRLIAPLLKDKTTDPAILVLDEAGKFTISLCSGHRGGADRLAGLVSHMLGTTPVITGASAHLGLPGIDILGTPFGWMRGTGDWTGVSAAIAKGEPVRVIQEVGSTLWCDRLPDGHPFRFGFAESAQTEAEKARVWISFTQRQFSPESEVPKVQWHPRVLWVGVGCERGTPREVIEKAIGQVFRAYHLAEGAIAGIATLDLKADEVGLVELCGDRNFPLTTFQAHTLRQISVPNPSAVVDSEVGTPSVAEAAAMLAAGAEQLLVPKQIYRAQPEEVPVHAGKAVTVAIAQAEYEYTARLGQLYLVGTGPGNLDQMTAAAKSAIASADAIIGYSLYIDLISPLLRPGQIIEALPITQEKQRAQRAIELAQWGLTVAVISSGDCGIYGMAGLVLEALQAQGWDGKTPGVQVFPGISALQATASRVGAPLMHDFCAISLSDLLTPWEVIQRRLTAAAQADFITALYNPKSQTRTQQIAIAQSIFLQYRSPQTPVAIARSVYRQDEEIYLTTLEKMLETPIDMLTTVLIGNSNTRTLGEWMITPRGYHLGQDICQPED
ncbi:precorrin-3B C(17)-methyltransferase [Desertifilum sp. FACHB-1129]|uniref:Precorrin-3B C(17)-methyltransferase n=1 Tax=Desertifilum tharense IPPAS B-1220 TaxID=1781255 RepID=A0A1E5QF24_9CYAN|nr:MULTISPECIES: precorrin-3B C(17)-methyltransferase [Desertifilum]MDA0212811.1 precorrin-3B C(17)-methyltransferase [Cyanobacteria bacterium FC1]MBD2314481.1 precorrin-3B C(17)-methyltransferase [Desertifilum sp. FACHB-1129]MBD2321730.1 precorrin-3B C(17)-methyltransferase [Desertifilum sp. FACHB-866]MBD2331857.1 precorrin-3B C(17)-methyltransferase [Desertifilum sp. FACHB-868]OEJ73280.1 precorrin-3B C(17)-methyltransferase [Desertifilum tharense IPPAS B-1220]